MANLREIVQLGDPILRQRAAIVRRFDDNLHKLLDDMANTMIEANGVGLAAPQIGISKRIAVIRTEDSVIELINPVLTNGEGEEVDEERCLSVPDKGGLVKRYTQITINAKNRHGDDVEIKAEEYMARVFQHEMDHLDGRLFIDIMTEEITD